MLQVAITSKGQITIPKRIRDALHLSIGDKIGFVLSGDEAIIRPISKSAADVFGLLSSASDKARSVDEIDERLKQAFKKGKI